MKAKPRRVMSSDDEALHYLNAAKKGCDVLIQTLKAFPQLHHGIVSEQTLASLRSDMRDEFETIHKQLADAENLI